MLSRSLGPVDHAEGRQRLLVAVLVDLELRLLEILDEPTLLVPDDDVQEDHRGLGAEYRRSPPLRRQAPEAPAQVGRPRRHLETALQSQSKNHGQRRGRSSSDPPATESGRRGLGSLAGTPHQRSCSASGTRFSPGRRPGTGRPARRPGQGQIGRGRSPARASRPPPSRTPRGRSDPPREAPSPSTSRAAGNLGREPCRVLGDGQGLLCAAPTQLGKRHLNHCHGVVREIR